MECAVWYSCLNLALPYLLASCEVSPQLVITHEIQRSQLHLTLLLLQSQRWLRLLRCVRLQRLLWLLFLPTLLLPM
jgi:hypothetical protein